jgi:hypothetical protein
MQRQEHDINGFSRSALSYLDAAALLKVQNVIDIEA